MAAKLAQSVVFAGGDLIVVYYHVERPMQTFLEFIDCPIWVGPRSPEPNIRSRQFGNRLT